MDGPQSGQVTLADAKARFRAAAEVNLSQFVSAQPLTSALIALELGLIVGRSPKCVETLLDLVAMFVQPKVRG